MLSQQRTNSMAASPEDLTRHTRATPEPQATCHAPPIGNTFGGNCKLQSTGGKLTVDGKAMLNQKFKQDLTDL